MVKNKIGFKITVIVILVSIIFTIIYYFCFRNKNNEEENIQPDIGRSSNIVNNSKNNTNKKVINSTAEVSSALTEKIELHATYYLEESYINENGLVKIGENILKYTNGTYLTAPYDCVINKINIPNKDEKCTNEHYIQISSNNTLRVQINVDETKINSISVGKKANVEISALESKNIEGTITKISSTASNRNFTVTVEFENDGSIKLGMTANVSI